MSLFASAYCISLALFLGLRYFSPHAAPVYVYLVIPGLICSLMSLLLGDLISCIRWIARNPVTEMSPRPFV